MSTETCSKKPSRHTLHSISAQLPALSPPASQSDVSKHHDQNVSSYTTLADRLTKLEQLFSALPAWKSDLVRHTWGGGVGRERGAALKGTAECRTKPPCGSWQPVANLAVQSAGWFVTMLWGLSTTSTAYEARICTLEALLMSLLGCA